DDLVVVLDFGIPVVLALDEGVARLGDRRRRVERVGPGADGVRGQVLVLRRGWAHDQARGAREVVEECGIRGGEGDFDGRVVQRGDLVHVRHVTGVRAGPLLEAVHRYRD